MFSGVDRCRRVSTTSALRRANQTVKHGYSSKAFGISFLTIERESGIVGRHLVFPVSDDVGHVDYMLHEHRKNVCIDNYLLPMQ